MTKNINPKEIKIDPKEIEIDRNELVVIFPKMLWKIN